MPDNKYIHDAGCKEAVCVDAGRVYDSCSDKDCLEDLQVYFTERDQMVIDHAVSVRAKKAEVITTYIDVEALPFNRGWRPLHHRVRRLRLPEKGHPVRQ